MMNRLNEILNWTKDKWTWLHTKANALWWDLLDWIYRLLCRIFGEDKVEAAFIKYYKKLAEVKKKTWEQINLRVDTQGERFPLVYKIWKGFAYSILGVCAFLFCLNTNFLWLCGRMPSIEQLQNPKVAQASEILSLDGVPMGKFFTENRVSVDSADISPNVFNALIATEDVRFFQHSGIDPKSLAGVAIGILKGGERGGGSTISQQLAKNLYSTRRKDMEGLLYYLPIVKTIVYKTKEWLTAISLERNFTKGEILTMYLNAVPYGNNTFGIKMASKAYFDKLPKDLKVEEAAVLVGLQKGTTLYNPIRNPKNSLKRRNTVIQLMAKNGVISQKQADAHCKKPIDLNLNFDGVTDGQGSYFKSALARYLEKWAKEKEIDLDLYKDGLKIYTTLDSRMQDFAEGAMREKMKYLQRTFDAQWSNQNPWTDEQGKEIPNFIEKVAQRTEIYRKLKLKYKDNQDSINYYMNKPKRIKLFSWSGDVYKDMSPMDSIRYYKRFLQSGLMAFDPYTGHIKAWVGGINYDYFKYDHVKQGRRQPGSSFKPILYCAAIDGPKNMSPCTRFRDEPFRTEWKENGQTKIWEPKNATGRFSMENLTLRKAIARSVNSVAAKLAVDEVGPDTVVHYARKLGITGPLDAVGSIGLGSSDVSLYDLVAAYGVFANNGIYTEPVLVARIEDAKGKVLYEFTPEKRQAISEESAFLMTFMMRGGVEESGGTGRGLFTYDLFKNHGQVAGKTGTTSNYSDAWYVGFTKDLVCGVWVGGDDRSIHLRGAMGEGASSALPIFGRFMEKVYGTPSLGYKTGPFPKPAIKITKPYMECATTDIGGIGSTNDSTSTIYSSNPDSASSATPPPAPRPRQDSAKRKEGDDQI